MEPQKLIKNLLQKGELYTITDSSYFSQGNVELVKEFIRSGIKIIQYREKKLSDTEMYQELIKIRKLTLASGTLLIINDHVDLCKKVGADGVHLGQKDMTVLEARAKLGSNAIIGLSTHNEEQGSKGIQMPLDYLAVGPVFKTKTKPNEPVAGLSLVKIASRKFNIPLVGIGGITESNLSDVLRMGIRSVCIIGDLLNSSDIASKVQRIKNELQRTL